MSPIGDFVKLHSLSSNIGQRLNGKTGRLKAWCENVNGKLGNNRYEVVVETDSGTESYMIKLYNMYAVEKRWIEEVSKSPMRKCMQDMMTKFEAPGINPCPISELQVLPQHFDGPGTDRQKLQSWWGEKVFQYIREKMEEQRKKRGQANWDMDAAIDEGTLWLAGVRSDGGHDMQERPSACQSPGVMVWPTIVFPRKDDRALYDGLFWWSYCQGLALNGSSPWKASPDALEIYGPYQFIAEVRLWPFGTLMINECQDDEDENDYDSHSWDQFEHNEEDDDHNQYDSYYYYSSTTTGGSQSDSNDSDFAYNEDDEEDDEEDDDEEGWQLI